MPWYSFTPTGSAPFNVGDPNNYTLVGSTPPSCPNPNLHLCAIQANDNLGKPLLTDINLAFEIATAINSNIESVNVLLRPNLT